MKQWQWWILGGGLLAVVLAAVLVLDSLSRIYTTLAAISPLLAQIVLGLLLVLLLVALGIGLYRLWPFLRPRRRRVAPPPPRTTAEAASLNLEAVQRQVEQLQNQVARQAILEQSRALQAAMNRGDLTLAVFGVGSAGKTSLINALLGSPLVRWVQPWAPPNRNRSMTGSCPTCPDSYG